MWLPSRKLCTNYWLVRKISGRFPTLYIKSIICTHLPYNQERNNNYFYRWAMTNINISIHFPIKEESDLKNSI